MGQLQTKPKIGLETETQRRLSTKIQEAAELEKANEKDEKCGNSNDKSGPRDIDSETDDKFEDAEDSENTNTLAIIEKNAVHSSLSMENDEMMMVSSSIKKARLSSSWEEKRQTVLENQETPLTDSLEDFKSHAKGMGTGLVCTEAEDSDDSGSSTSSLFTALSIPSIKASSGAQERNNYPLLRKTLYPINDPRNDGPDAILWCTICGRRSLFLHEEYLFDHYTRFHKINLDLELD